MSKRLRDALIVLHGISDQKWVIVSRSRKAMSAQVVTNWFFTLYLGLVFCGFAN